MNRLGPGHNVRLLLAMLDCENAHELRTVGERHEDEGFPRGRCRKCR